MADGRERRDDRGDPLVLCLIVLGSISLVIPVTDLRPLPRAYINGDVSLQYVLDGWLFGYGRVLGYVVMALFAMLAASSVIQVLTAQSTKSL